MNEELLKKITRAYSSFKYFQNEIFPSGYPENRNYVGGKHIDEWADCMQGNKFAAFLSARKHSKSTTAYGYVIWNILRSVETDLEILYISYNSALAAYHTRNIKTMIKRNPYFQECKDLSPAEGIMKYSWDGKHSIRVEPEGILSFKRGRHPDIVIVDDPLQDPSTALNLTIITKISRVFLEDIMSLPQEGTGQLKVVGTAQHSHDLFFTIKKLEHFYWGMYPAINSFSKKEVLWPEYFPYERLIEIRDKEIGEKAFSKEYMCSPVLSEEAFFKREDLDPIIDPKLENHPLSHKIKTKNEVFAGMDIGKKRHPSHIAVFENVKGVLVQRHEIFMDGWDYLDQVNYCRELIDNFKIDRMFYDNTRGEFESYYEENRLPSQMRPVVFSLKTKSAMASRLEQVVKEKKLKLLDNSRMINQILIMDNSLDCIETSEGHGDSFWSIALACMGMRSVDEAEMVDIDVDDMFGEPSDFARF